MVSVQNVLLLQTKTLFGIRKRFGHQKLGIRKDVAVPVNKESRNKSSSKNAILRF